MSLDCRLFQAKSIQGPKDSGRNSALPPNCLKNVDSEPLPGKERHPGD